MTNRTEVLQTGSPNYLPLDPDTERSLVGGLLEDSPEFAETDVRFGLVLLSHDSPYSDLARSIESEVFHEFFDNDPELMQREYGPYEDASKFFVVVDREDNRRAGVMRLLHDSSAGFKALSDVHDMGVTELSPEDIMKSFEIKDSSRLIEIATIAAAPDYRGKKSDQLVSAAMYRALYQYCNTQGYDDLIAVIDAKPLENLRAIHLPVATSPYVASPFEYLDAKENNLIHIPVTEIDTYMKSRDPDTFDFLLGNPGGLDPFCALSFHEK